MNLFIKYMSAIQLTFILLLILLLLLSILIHFSIGIAYGNHFGDIIIVSNIFTGREFSNGTKSLEFFPNNLIVNVGAEPIQWINEFKEPHTVTFIPESLITRLSKFNDSSNVMDSILDSLNNGDANLKTKLTPKTQFLITNNNNKVFTSQKNIDDNITLNQSVSIFNSDIISLNNNNNNNNNQNNSLSDITINFQKKAYTDISVWFILGQQ